MVRSVPPIVRVSGLFQAGMVVKDIDKGIGVYGHLFGIDPRSWWVVTVGTGAYRLTCRGKSSTHGYKAAMTMVGPLMIELLQPLEGYGTYRRFHLMKS